MRHFMAPGCWRKESLKNKIRCIQFAKDNERKQKWLEKKPNSKELSTLPCMQLEIRKIGYVKYMCDQIKFIKKLDRDKLFLQHKLF